MTPADYIRSRGTAEGYDGPLVHSFMVGHRRVTMAFDIGRAQPLSSTWMPRLPRRLSKNEWRQYRAGRRVLIGYIAVAFGGRGNGGESVVG